MSKSKKVLLILGLCLDIAITIGLFVIHIIMLVNLAKAGGDPKNLTDPFAVYLSKNTMVYLFAFVVPLFLLLAGNIAGLFIYVKKTNKDKKVELSDLSDEEKEALRRELLKDLTK